VTGRYWQYHSEMSGLKDLVELSGDEKLALAIFTTRPEE
jgi:hypothetical protein